MNLEGTIQPCAAALLYTPSNVCVCFLTQFKNSNLYFRSVCLKCHVVVSISQINLRTSVLK